MIDNVAFGLFLVTIVFAIAELFRYQAEKLRVSEEKLRLANMRNSDLEVALFDILDAFDGMQAFHSNAYQKVSSLSRAKTLMNQYLPSGGGDAP